MRPHPTRTASGIEIPDPDQGTPYLQVQFTMPSTMLMVWEPWGEEEIAENPELGKCGHNLEGFAKRWAAWAVSREPFLQAIDPRYGFPMLIPRSAIAHVAGFIVAYHRREDVRAGVRAVAVPGRPSVRQLGDGSFEIAIPR